MGTWRGKPNIDLKGFLANLFVYSCVGIEIVFKAFANIKKWKNANIKKWKNTLTNSTFYI